MVLLDTLLDIFCSHAAVVNEDSVSLKEEVKIVEKKFGRWFRVRGFTSYKDLFFALHLARAKHRPYTVAFLREDEPQIGELVLKKVDPFIRTHKYSDTQELESHLVGR
jgi:hypothetical protein